MNTKVLVCKAKPPVEGADVIDEQVRLAHQYQCRLIELHRDFARRREDAKRLHCPQLGEAETALLSADELVETLVKEIRQRNAAARRKAATREDRERLTAARAAVRTARDAVRVAREVSRKHPGYQAALAALIIEYQGSNPDPRTNRRSGGLLKEARKNCGVYPGTYLRVEASVEQTLKTTRGELRIPRWTGDGLCGPQLTPPLSVAGLRDCEDTRLRMEVLHDPNRPRRGVKLMFWVRIGSNPDRSPVWAKIPAWLSPGQLPDDAVICWATIVRRQVGVRRFRDPDCPEGVYKPHYEWSVQLTIRTETEKEKATSGACGINLGWRVMGDGLIRYATIVADDGRVEHHDLPNDLIRRFARVKELYSVRDNTFSAIVLRLQSWLKDTPHPEWLRVETETLHQWRSERRLGRLCGRWTRNRFPGDEMIVQELCDWRRKDVYLEQYAIKLSRKASRIRRNLYRQFAARVRKTWRYVAIDDTAQQQLVRLPEPEDNDTVNQTARYNARIVAPSSLRQLLRQDGATMCDPANITRTCHACGSIESWDQEKELSHICEGCGDEWDQDVNAAKNLLTRMVTSMNESPPVRDTQPDDKDGDTTEQPDRGGRWARRKADRSRRLDGEQGTQ